MAVQFSEDRWKRIRGIYADWWEHKLDRPVINVEFYGVDPGMDKPMNPVYLQTYKYDFSMSVETIIQHWEYMLSCRKYTGDSYPIVLPDFGPGVNAAFVGAKTKVTSDTVWFLPPDEQVPFNRLHFEFNPDEVYFKRIKNIYEEAASHFDGKVVLAMTHLNNGIDTVARFYDGTAMVLGLYDEPYNIERLIWENHTLFMRYIQEFVKSMGVKTPGYSCWGNIYAEEPWMGIQCDFCAMIGPNDFKRFILPELKACCDKLKYNYYHLDGPGQLAHLDMICEIPTLKCIQWVPGTGNLDEIHWQDVYRKINRSGKNIWLTGPIEYIDIIAEQIGTAKGIYWSGAFPIEKEEKIMKILEKFNVD